MSAKDLARKMLEGKSLLSEKYTTPRPRARTADGRQVISLNESNEISVLASILEDQMTKLNKTPATLSEEEKREALQIARREAPMRLEILQREAELEEERLEKERQLEQAKLERDATMNVRANTVDRLIAPPSFQEAKKAAKKRAVNSAIKPLVNAGNTYFKDYKPANPLDPVTFGGRRTKRSKKSKRTKTHRKHSRRRT
jgi:hypothetical protein